MLLEKLEEIEFYFPHMQVTRSSIKKGDLVPLHTHANKYGFVYVLQGRCQIVNYSICKQEGSHYLLKLIADKEYSKDDYTIVTRKNNVHSILALEDTTFLDVFTVGFEHESIQRFLKITGKVQDAQEVIANEIDISEANIPQHLLEKICTEIDITD